MTGEAQAENGAAQPQRLGGRVTAPQQRDGETTATQRQHDGERRRRSGDGDAAQRGVVQQPRDGGAAGPQQRRGVR